MDKNDLFRAAQTNDVKLFERCIAEGMDPRTTGDRGETIIHYISMKNSYGLLCHIAAGYNDVVKALVNTADNDRDSPMHWCSFSSTPALRIYEKLLTLSADPLQKDQWEQSCIELAAVRGRTDLVTFMKWREAHPQGLPKDIQGLDNISILQYINTFGSMNSSHALLYEMAMKGKKEKSSHIRIIFLGYQGVGKTTLYYRLTGQKRQVLSTDNLEIFQNRLIIDRVTMKRKLLEEGLELETSLERIRDVVIGSMTTDDVTVDVIDGKPDIRRPVSARIDNRLKPPTAIKRTRSEPDALADLQAEAAVLMSQRPVERFGSCGQKTFVSVFDFGGESMFSNLQHIFLNSNAVILLVFSLHNCFKEEAIFERVCFWLKFIASYSCQMTEVYCPPIILVGTHLDQIETEQKRNLVVSQVNRALFNNPETAKIFQKHVFKFLTVDSTTELENCDSLEVLWAYIIEAAQYQSHWGQLLPGNWIALEREIMRLKVHKKVMTFEGIRVIGENLTVPLDAEEVKAMLEYLHMMRCILCFNMDLPKANMILDPQWMVQAFRKIVTVDKFFDKIHGKNHPLLKAYRQTGKLTMEFIEYVWKGDLDFLEFKNTLLYYLERLELLVKPLPEKGESVVNYYIVPCMLQPADSELIRTLIEAPKTVKTATLVFDFQGQFLPPAVFNKILASCIHRFKVMQASDGSLYLQQGLACFVLNPRWNMVLHCRDALMKVTLFSQSRDNPEFEVEAVPGEGFSIRQILEEIVKATLERNNQDHISYTYYLHNHFQISPGEKLFDITDVMNTPVPSDGLGFDEVDACLSPLNRLDYEVWFLTPVQTPRKEKRNVQEDRKLARCVSPREMSRIAKYVGTCYSLFFTILGLEDNAIDHIRLQYGHFHFRSQVTKMLIVWRNKMKTRATLLEVVKAMEFNELCVDDMLNEILSDSFLIQTATNMTSPDDVDISLKVQRSCPSDQDKWTFAECIGNMYFNAMIELGLKNQCIERAEMDHRNRVLYIIHALLTDWVNSQGSEATILKLYLALEECQGDCLDFADGINQNRSEQNIVVELDTSDGFFLTS
ncbi:uncharacterized protein LOC110447355 [Mizuhopecten yessoensis]|uniref:non-specific serine/threonine protein kinase n=1 Tax=Mizuhopecten yessoensis TaxID=6573 RepID=A0A210QVR5_MIZYE|nr:uncharacterized protein LOC110447355 [Mizuhopecten yessoensis]XP_021348649.1 uncharacterized protein LOC110447355 [Mizuhopecten yessoensis]OWF52752.1 serine/threonine-protein kinase pats1 [Mizuhopecten yessoensis]